MNRFEENKYIWRLFLNIQHLRLENYMKNKGYYNSSECNRIEVAATFIKLFFWNHIG